LSEVSLLKRVEISQQFLPKDKWYAFDRVLVDKVLISDHILRIKTPSIASLQLIYISWCTSMTFKWCEFCLGASIKKDQSEIDPLRNRSTKRVSSAADCYGRREKVVITNQR